MKPPPPAISTMDDYIEGFPKEIRKELVRFRKTIQSAAPKAEEAIFYGIPTFRLHGNLVHFAAFEHHFGFYPAPSAIKAFREELAAYKVSTGTIRFPFGKPLPWALIKRIVKFRVQEQLEKEKKGNARA